MGDEVIAPLRAYLRGHATGDPAHCRDAFLPTAHVEGIRDGGFVSWRLDEYCALFPGRPAPDEPARSRRIDSVDVHGTIATASMTLRHGADTFTDVCWSTWTAAGASPTRPTTGTRDRTGPGRSRGRAAGARPRAISVDNCRAADR